VSALAVPASHRTWLWLGNCAVPAVINAALNPTIAGLQTRGHETLPIWSADAAFGPDTIGTAFFLPAITCLIVTALVRRSVRQGAVEPLPPLAWNRRPGLLRRAARFGLLGVLGFAIPVIVLVELVGVTEMARTPFLVWKAISTGVMGAIVTPWIARVAVADAPTGAEGRAEAIP